MRAPSAMVSGLSTVCSLPSGTSASRRRPPRARRRSRGSPARGASPRSRSPRAARRRRSGTSRKSSGPASSISSFAAVPCPAMTCGWSNGGMSVRPRSRGEPLRDRLAVLAVAVVERRPRRRSRASPSSLTARRVRRHHDDGRDAEQPPASATACAWLPDENATTPRALRSRRELRRARCRRRGT